MEYLGTDVATKHPQIYAVTGCDTTSFLHAAGKLFLKTALIEKLRLLNPTSGSCKVSDTAVKDVKKFIQTICYSGKEEESLTETKVRLYEQMKTKTRLSLPLHGKSMLHAIKNIHYEIYDGSRVDEAIISDYLLKDNG